MDQTVLNFTRVSPVTLEAMEMVLFRTSRRSIGFFHSFYEECRDNPAFATYPIPMLILHGQYDDYVPMADIQHLRDLNDRSKLVIIPGASHQFLEPGAWDMVLDLTRDWFEFEQVLLSETF
jgi:pimeloyl-ACP methyl ester carboxylesterase